MSGLRRRAWNRALLLASALAAAALPAAAGSPAEGFNLILVGWDTLRADRVGALGYGGAATPNLDALARQGCLFTSAVSPASWTLPAFMSWFTSLYPRQHGLANKFRVASVPGRGGGRSQGKAELRPNSLSADFLTLPEILRAHGYTNAGFTGGAGVSGEFGFARGFSVYKDSANFAGFGQTVPQALEWLRGHPGEKFFLFVHGYDCHAQSALAKGQGLGSVSAAEAAEFQERHPRYRMAGIEGRPLAARPQDPGLWSRIYDEKLKAADRAFGELVDFVAATPALSSRTVIIVASDHGEELFEHGRVDHGMTLYEEVIRVPLVVYVPGLPHRVIDQQVRTLDLLPTILELLGLAPSERLRRQMRGESLAAHLRGEGKPLDAFSETDYLLHARLRSLRRAGGWKLIHDERGGERQLFDLRADPGEKRDVFDAESGRAFELEDLLYRSTGEAGTGR